MSEITEDPFKEDEFDEQFWNGMISFFHVHGRYYYQLGNENIHVTDKKGFVKQMKKVIKDLEQENPI